MQRLPLPFALVKLRRVRGILARESGILHLFVAGQTEAAVFPPAFGPMISRFITKTAAITTVVVVSNAVGNYTLGKGMQQVGHLVTWQPGPYLQAFANPWVISGVILLIAWLIFRLALLSWADLSYVITVTSTSYIISALLGKFFLSEQVSALRWVGIALITLGAVFVGETFPSTTDETGGLAEE